MAAQVQGLRPGRQSASTTRSALIITSSHSPAPSASREPTGIKPNNAKLENTYLLEPTRHFPVDKARNAVQETLEGILNTEEYDPSKTKKWCQEIANIIKNKVKAISSNRYKIVALVVVGQKEVGTFSLASRCVWNDKFDTYVEASFSNHSLYAVGLVYGVYQD